MLIEDHQIVREGLKQLIEMEDTMAVDTEAGTCQASLDLFHEDIDVILLDIKLPDGDGLDLFKKLKLINPKVKAIALTTYDDPLFIKKAIESGVNGFVPKYASFEEIKSAILITNRMGRYLYPGLNTEALMNLSELGLSDIEIQILQQIADGESQKNIADHLFMSLSTMRRRLNGICLKLGVQTVEQALALAVKKGLVL